MSETKTWCPQCGPGVDVDEDGCCGACGADATGAGADEAHAWRTAAEAANDLLGVSVAQSKVLRDEVNRLSAAGRSRWGLLFLAFCCGFAVAVALLAAFAGTAHARWSEGAAERIAEQAPMIRLAADTFGVDPVLLAALGAHETLALPLVAFNGEGSFGSCQVHWGHWGWLMAERGIATRPEQLLDPGLGWLAGAAVLAQLVADYPPRSVVLLCCLYSTGTAALAYHTDCPHGLAVERNMARARRALE